MSDRLFGTIRRCVAVGVFCLFTSAAHSQQTGVPYSIWNVLSGVMGVPESCIWNTCPVQSQTWEGVTEQLWSLAPTGTQGFYNIVNQTSGIVLDVPTPECYQNNGCRIQQWESNGSWQQQWTPIPTDTGWTFTLANRLSGKVIDNPTQCAGLDGCNLQQWDSNGGPQQQCLFIQQNTGQSNYPPSVGVTILVNGSFDDDPSWIQSSDPEYQAIAAILAMRQSITSGTRMAQSIGRIIRISTTVVPRSPTLSIA